jgi:hypothetical protein
MGLVVEVAAEEMPSGHLAFYAPDLISRVRGVVRPSAVQVAGHVFSAGVRRVVMLVVPPVWMGLR